MMLIYHNHISRLLITIFLASTVTTIQILIPIRVENIQTVGIEFAAAFSLPTRNVNLLKLESRPVTQPVAVNQYRTLNLSSNSLSSSVISPSTVHILVPSDEIFHQKYHLTVDTMRCYAKKFGYTLVDYKTLNNAIKDQCECLHDEETSGHIDKVEIYYRYASRFFFLKHCMVSCYLQIKGPNKVRIAAVFDADTMSASLDQPLDFWLNKLSPPEQSHAPETDILFYKRCQFTEMTAGNYMVRNTSASIDFLRGWAELWRYISPGFSSADNGAIHMHLLRVINAPGMQNFDGQKYGLEGKSYKRIPSIKDNEETHPCAILYRDTLTPLDDNLKPYFKFTNCAMKHLGLEGNSSLISTKFAASGSNGVRFVGMKDSKTKKNKFSFLVFRESRAWVHDFACGYPQHMSKLQQPRPLFFHGIKSEHILLSYWNPKIQFQYGSTFDEPGTAMTLIENGNDNNMTVSIYPKCSLREGNSYGLSMQYHKCTTGKTMNWKCLKNEYKNEYGATVSEILD